MKFLILVLAFLGSHAWAFPEMVTHGYTHCNACHVQLTGSGLLNEYGRSLSRELLSQPTIGGIPTNEGDEKFLYGYVKPPAWLTLGGDARVLQYFAESKQASSGRFLIMQTDFDISAQVTSWFRTFVSVGRVEPRVSEATAKDFVSSPRHGVEFLLTPPDAENRFAIRAGRFMPAYGIGFAEHVFVTRKTLNFQPGEERYAYELSWADQHSSVIATGIMSRADGNGIRDEKGGAVQASTSIGEKSKVGLNYYQTQRQDASLFTRRIYGAFAHIYLDEDWYALVEADRPQNEQQKWGFLDVLKVGYVVHQGWHLVGVQQYQNLDMENPFPRFESYSIGTEWFPRPHWDFYVLFSHQRDTALNGDDFQDVLWLLGHFYL